MQKAASIIFLMLFIAIQYGKLISYWNCRIINSTSIQDAHCDCEKLLTEDKNGNADFHTGFTTPVKMEEWSEGPYGSTHAMAVNYLPEMFIEICSPASNGFHCSIFQPPRA